MNKYYFYHAEGPYVNSGLDLKYQLDTNDFKNSKDIELYLDGIGADRFWENWADYVGSEDEDEEVETEANFYFTECTEDEFNECEDEEIQ